MFLSRMGKVDSSGSCTWRRSYFEQGQKKGGEGEEKVQDSAQELQQRAEVSQHQPVSTNRAGKGSSP